MNVRPAPAVFALDSFLLQQENKSLLRFVACGSVDHGKSTLIGQLLYGVESVFDDQLGALRRESRKHGTQGEELDFSLLLDGLAAEREQKITIDVAYRFFSTAKRKFIVADTPGHEQYTRNMATGASTADLALILVDAASGLRAQTRRHALIVSSVGVRHIALVVNKMDKVGWSEDAFRAIEREFHDYAGELGVEKLVCIPAAARSGDNVVDRSAHIGWYDGPTVLEYLENADVAKTAPRAFRMPVQGVNRPDPEFRGYNGMVSSGEARPGMPVQILPSGQTSHVARIVTYDGDLEVAQTGRSVTLTLADDIDVSRGDVIAAIEQPPAVTDKISARVVWMDSEPLVPGRSYFLKLGASSTVAVVRSGLRVLDLDSRNSTGAAQLAANDIGHAVFDLDRQIAVDAYADHRGTGAFILIDRDTYDTVAMGIVERERPIGLVSGLRDFFLSRIGARAASTERPGESHGRSIAKALSWRATGSIDTFVITLIITGSGVWASSIAATEIFTKIAFYYLHERAWSFVRWGRS
jgi:sulfate adenylyltransferase large subunit